MTQTVFSMAEAGGRKQSVFLASAFRPFFLLAGLQAALALPIWLALYFGEIELPTAFAPSIWHAHEMLFGFAGAAVAGFLLTAVPNWTGTTPVRGRPLGVLVALWVAGRLGVAASAVVPPSLVAVVDVAFFPLLGSMLALPLIRAGKASNTAFLALLTLLAVANLLTHLDAVGVMPGGGAMGVLAALDILLVMITVIGGRIVPAFTRNALRMQGMDPDIRFRPWVERTVVPAMLAILVLDIAAPESIFLGIVAAVAAVLHVVRLSAWAGEKTLRQPILWVLHLGYGWLAVGLALRAVAVFTPDVVASTTALHALTIGTVGTMVLGVTTRAALGHAGRPLVVSAPIAVAYALVSVAAVVRVVVPTAAPADALIGNGVAGVVWTVAFALFVVVYWPILTRPRADGRPG